jgi:hypothetical protein
MSLTSSYLDDPTSPLRQFLTERFPRTSSFYKLCKLPPGPVQTMRPTNAEGYPWGRIAMALDYRIRYYFPSVASEGLAAYKGADGLLPKKVIRSFFTSLEHDILLSIRPVRRRLEQVQEEMLARYCVVLSLFEELYRNPRRSIEHSPLFVPKPKRNWRICWPSRSRTG